MLLNANITAAQPAPASLTGYQGSSLQLIGSAEGLARKTLDLVSAAGALNRVPLVADRDRQNERVYDKLGYAIAAVDELLEGLLKARAAVAPAEEA